MSKGKVLISFAWLALIGGSLYFRANHPSALSGGMRHLASISVLWAYAFYFGLGCVRGFTFMPLTILLGFGILFLNPIPLFTLTMAGALVSSWGIYHFSSFFELHQHFERNNKKHVAALERGMKEYELPIIIGWSFCPVLPTDLVCYVSGIMKLSLSKLLFGMLVGEGVCCALYIFFGIEVFQYFGFGK